MGFNTTQHNTTQHNTTQHNYPFIAPLLHNIERVKALYKSLPILPKSFVIGLFIVFGVFFSSSVARADTTQVDLYLDFENGDNIDTITTTILDNATHPVSFSGTWSLQTDPAIGLMISSEVNAEMQLRNSVVVGGATYTDSGSTRGMKIDLKQGAKSIRLSSTPALSSASVGFFLYSPGEDTYEIYGVFSVQQNSGDYFALHYYTPGANSGQAAISCDTTGTPNGPKINLTQSTLYWVTAKFVQNGISSCAVYETSTWTQVGTTATNTASDSGIFRFDLGKFSGGNYGTAPVMYIDDFLIDWTNAAFPLGMGTTATPPTLTTSAPTSVATSTIILNSSITADGNASTTVRGFAWGTSSTLTIGTATTTENGTFGISSFSTTITNLAPNTTYYFRAYSTNSAGTGYGSILSTTTLPWSVPTAPTDVTVTTSTPNQATVSFTPGANGGSSILYYLASSTPGNITATGSGSPITVTGLTNGTAYTFQVYAVNLVGTSTPSSASNAVTPTATVVVNANSCSQSDVQSAIDSAPPGGMVQVPSGNCTWNNTVNITKAINLIGAGQTSTIITANGVLAMNVAPSTGDTRISGFGFTGSGGNTGLETSLLKFGGSGGGTWNSMRLDHVQFTDFSNWAVVIGEWYELTVHPKMLIDHITSNNVYNTGFMKIAGNNNTWKLADQYGTDFAIYIEDSHFSWSTPNFYNFITDTEHGVRMVIRHNILTNSSIQMHDTGSTQGAKGNRIAEIYSNIFNCTSTCNFYAIGLRGGGYIVYDNVINSGFNGPAWPQIWRAITSFGGGFLGCPCNGTPVPTCDTPNYYHCSGGDHRACGYPGDSVCNGIGTCQVAASNQEDCPVGVTFLPTVDNVDGGNDLSGWPCRNQTGWGMESADGLTEQPSPVYWYNNTDGNGTIVNFESDNSQPTYFQQNRDYCYHNPSTSCGAKASWTYTAYTYPHSLEGASVVITPTLTTSAPTSVSTSTLTLNANISATGGASVTESGFAYGTDSTLATVISTTTLGAQNTGDFSGGITGLTLNTLYYFRAYAVNSAGTSTGEILSTTTLATTPPTLSSLGPSSLTSGTYTRDSTPTLTFTTADSDSDSVAYELEVDNNSDFSSLTYSGTSSYAVAGAVSTTTGVLPEGSYYWRVRVGDGTATSSYTTANSGQVAFTVDTTNPTPGDITFSDVTSSSITATTTATDANGLASPPFVYRNVTLDTYSEATSTSITFTGLSESTAYTYEVGVQDIAGNWATSTQYATTTSAIVTSTITTLDASSLAATAATLNGNLSATGGANPTQHGFAWGTDSALSSAATTTEGAKSGTGTFTSAVSSLTCNTTYYSRAYATNSAGTGYGDIQSFTTSACPVAAASATTQTTSSGSSASTRMANLREIYAQNNIPCPGSVCGTTPSTLSTQPAPVYEQNTTRTIQEGTSESNASNASNDSTVSRPSVLSVTLTNALKDLPSEIITLVSKFPELSKTLTSPNILKNIKNIPLTLPTLSKKMGNTTGIPLSSLSSIEKKSLPTDVVFAKSGELIDYNVSLTVAEDGKAEQVMHTVAGKSIDLALKPEKPVKEIKGYLTIKKIDRIQAKRKIQANSMLTASIGSLLAQSITETPVIDTKLVLSAFNYVDADKDGIYTASINAPLIHGEYDIMTIVTYKDEKQGSKEFHLTTVVDPEGYVFTKNGRLESRIPDAAVTILQKNPKSGSFEKWPASKYKQINPQKTDITGMYSFLVPEGKYKLTVTASGYYDYNGKEFEVIEGQGIHENIEMKAKGWWRRVWEKLGWR